LPERWGEDRAEKINSPPLKNPEHRQKIRRGGGRLTYPYAPEPPARKCSQSGDFENIDRK
jgi:hypothetical protein